MYTRCRFTGRRILKPGLKLIGGKTKLRDILYQLFPNHITYYEPFLGSGTVLIGNSIATFYNGYDINPHVPNFFRCVAYNTEEFWKMLQYQHSLLKKFKFTYFESIRDLINPNIKYPERNVEQAVYFYLITKHSMNGIYRINKEGRCNSSFCKTVEGRGIFDETWLFGLADRCRSSRTNNVLFSESDYKDVLWVVDEISKCNTDPNYNFVFLDPPYRFSKIKGDKGCVTTYNGIKFEDSEHLSLFKLLDNASYHWLMTINDDDWVRDVYKDYFIQPHDVFYSCSQTSAGRSRRPELLIANYDINTMWSNLWNKTGEPGTSLK